MNAQVKAKALKPLWRIENAAQAVFDPVPFKVYTQRDLERIPDVDHDGFYFARLRKRL